VSSVTLSHRRSSVIGDRCSIIYTQASFIKYHRMINRTPQKPSQRSPLCGIRAFSSQWSGTTRHCDQ